MLFKTDFYVGVRSRPDQREPRHPILAVDRLARPGVLFWRKDASCRGKFRSSHLSSNRAGCHAHLRIIADPLRLSHVAARHHIELAVVLAKPHRRRDCRAGLAKRCQGNIFLGLNGRRDRAGHKTYSKRVTLGSGQS